MEINKKKAPQKAVVEIVKAGGWGNVTYIHKLECGHTEIRKRHAGSKYIACSGCVMAKEMEATTKQLAQPVYVETAVIYDPVAAELASFEQDIGRIRASLAKALGVTVGDVELIVTEKDNGELSVSQAMVFLGPSSIDNLIKSVK
jgi:hypothetical protein